jgi:hypothetical protein
MGLNMEMEIFEDREAFEKRFPNLRWEAGRGFTVWRPAVIILTKHFSLCGDDYLRQSFNTKEGVTIDKMVSWCEDSCRERFSIPSPTAWKFEARDDAMRFRLVWS